MYQHTNFNKAIFPNVHGHSYRQWPMYQRIYPKQKARKLEEEIIITKLHVKMDFDSMFGICLIVRNVTIAVDAFPEQNSMA